MKYEKDFISTIEDGCYKRHRDKVHEYSKNSNTGELLIPYKYFVLGNYDFAFISVINNYDFAQKLFIPKFDSLDNKRYSPPYSYQIITGILNSTTENAVVLNKGLYYEFPFLAICNFKLNNGFLVGNGIAFTNDVAQLIATELNKILGSGKHIILHSFSWFEITLLIFAKEPNIISQALAVLRCKKIRDLSNSQSIIENSSKYNSFHGQQHGTNPDWLDILGKSDIFSDTQSYFCIRYDFLDNAGNDNVMSLNLNTEIEWQIKPGHFSAFKNVIEAKLADKFKLSNISLITGKGDYVIDEESTFFDTNYKIQQIVNEEIIERAKDIRNDDQLITHVRNIKTKVYLPSHEITDQPPPSVNPYKKQTSFREKIKHPLDINEYSTKLKQLKISKQCRANVLKMFYHYKNGINDPILAIYFFDFRYFIQSIEKEINDKCNFLNSYANSDFYEAGEPNDQFIKKQFTDVDDFETRLAKNFEIFEEAFNIRMLNTYRYEDISDLNLDFNSSIQELLSMYNTLAHVMGDIFYSPANHLIVLISHRTTVANVKSINYSVYDLLTPEFIFYSLPKEILNYYHLTAVDHKYVQAFTELENKFKLIIENVESENYSEFLNILFDSKILDFQYLFIEAIRFYYSFNLDEECFIYWTWCYAFKNSSAYNISGSFKEESFISEIIRLIFTLRLYNHETKKLQCPLPQLETYWQRLFPRINEEVTLFFENNAVFIKEFRTRIQEETERFVNEFDLEKVYSFNSGIPDNQYTKYLETGEDHVISKQLASISLYFEHKTQTEFNPGQTITKSNLREVMYRYLRFIYARNKSKSKYINFLYRDWNDGKPLRKFNEIQSEKEIDYFYRIDQTGGVFFPCMKKMEEYFQIRNALLVQLWDFAMRETNELIKKL